MVRIREQRSAWLWMLRLRHGPLNPDYKHHRLGLGGLSMTDTHVFFYVECDQRDSRQILLNSMRNIILKDQMFTLSQLNPLSQVCMESQSAVWPQ